MQTHNFGSLSSQNIENQQIMSAKYTVLMLHLRQNEHYRTFGMVAAGTSVIHIAKLSGCSSVIVHSLVRPFEQTGISVKALSPGDVRKRRRDKTVNLLLCFNVSSSIQQV